MQLSDSLGSYPISLKAKFYTKDLKVIETLEVMLDAMLVDVRLYLQ